MDWHHLASRWWLAPASRGHGEGWCPALAGHGPRLRREDVESGVRWWLALLAWTCTTLRRVGGQLRLVADTLGVGGRL